MARPILGALSRLVAESVLAIISLTTVAAAAQPHACSSARTEIQQFQEHVKAGSFYQELTRRFATPLSCLLEADDGTIGLTYSFRGGARLVARINSQIETSEQQIQNSQMEVANALRLLKAAEKNEYGEEGCGIEWGHPSEELPDGQDGSREAVYRGTNCSCQARVTSRKNRAILLVLKSAC